MMKYISSSGCLLGKQGGMMVDELKALDLIFQQAHNLSS